MRPLFFYLFLALASYAVHLYLTLACGFRIFSHGDTSYYVRRPPSSSPSPSTTPDPIMLYHGLGCGLLQYLDVIRPLLRRFPTHPIILPIQPQISMSIWHPRAFQPITRKEVMAGFQALLKKFAFDQVVICSHSLYVVF